jgi:thiamine phosphate synthase YjbQ (UPF0047 family)
VHELNVKTERRTQLIDITDQVRGALDGFERRRRPRWSTSPHTTAGRDDQRARRPDVARDFEDALEEDRQDGWRLEARRGGRGERALAHSARR